MREQIYTIPVSEGFEAEGECPFCAMYEKLESDVLDFTLGPSYMEQDVRNMTNESGFCREHYKMLYDAQNRLGLALMVSTHMAAIENKMTKLLKDARGEKEKRRLFGKNDGGDPLAEFAETLDKSCFMCDKINASMDRYFDTFFYLWKNEKDFREKVLASKGFCVRHFERLVTMSREKMGSGARTEFLNAAEKLQTENFKRVHDELLWFISKFDYRFKDKPWENSKDSLHRAIIKVASFDTEKGIENK